ncbi:MAG: hypothetical protein QOK43_1029 [Acidimicrobiaceae bacterium]|jgi:transcriptional regulator with XRE-family HTH domain|nr:hypothetical protein [Acidimicrobiaceae bacterium]
MSGRRGTTADPRTTWSARDRARELGDRVRVRRKALRLSQEQLGEACGLHRTYVGQVERGEVNVTVRNLLLLADGLGVDVAELVQGLREAS